MVVAISRVLNEADIAEQFVRWTLAQVDHLIVGVGPSTDGTTEVLYDLASGNESITLHRDDARNLDQCHVMTAYAHEARTHLGAQFVVPMDFDEIWHADEGTIAGALRELDDSILKVPARLLTHTCTPLDDPDEPDPFKRMRWREVEMLPLPKVACRALPNLAIGHGNHSCHYEGIRRQPEVSGVLAARHFPYRSPEQFITRVRGAYPSLQKAVAAGEFRRSHGQHMHEYGECLETKGEEGLREWFRVGMVQDPAERPTIVEDPAPCVLES